jgi:hypothetical protein
MTASIRPNPTVFLEITNVVSTHYLVEITQIYALKMLALLVVTLNFKTE